MSGMGSHTVPGGAGDDFFEQLLSMPIYGGGIAGAEEGSAGPDHGPGIRDNVVSSFFRGDGAVEYSGAGDRDLFVEGLAARRAPSETATGAIQIDSGSGDPGVPQSLAPGPRVRAKRGQATNPHSIAERLRRERIAERMRALQELVPKCNKTDRAAMLDEIVDYVKFLRLQVKVLSMSRHGGTGASSHLAADSPQSLVMNDEVSEDRDTNTCHGWEKWSVGDGTEQQVAKLMEEDVGAAMQFLQSNALCIMPIPLAASICRMKADPGTSL